MSAIPSTDANQGQVEKSSEVDVGEAMVEEDIEVKLEREPEGSDLTEGSSSSSSCQDYVLVKRSPLVSVRLFLLSNQCPPLVSAIGLRCSLTGL